TPSRSPIACSNWAELLERDSVASAPGFLMYVSLAAAAAPVTSCRDAFFVPLSAQLFQRDPGLSSPSTRISYPASRRRVRTASQIPTACPGATSRTNELPIVK